MSLINISFLFVLISFLLLLCSLVPALDEVLQPSTGSILGPIWVTKGERFSPKGAHDFLTTLVLNSKERIKKAKKRLAEVINFLKIFCGIVKYL